MENWRHLLNMIVVWTLLGQQQRVCGLIAYDCSDEKTNITVTSLRDVAKCPEPESSYKSESIGLRVVQRTEVGLQQVWTCLVEVTRLITYCGMHSHSSVVAGGLRNYVHQVGADECRMIHRSRTMKIYEQTIGQIVGNSTTTASITLLGSLASNGKCEGATYQENGMTWNNVIIIATVKIQIMDYFALVKLSDNEISLRGGVICSYLERYCFDSTLGESTWEYNTDVSATCEARLASLYDGRAEKVTNMLNGEQYIVVDTGPKIFAMTLLKKVQLCNIEFWQTEHPQLLVTEGRERHFQASAILSSQDIDLTAYVNSKFLYVEQSYKRSLETLYIDTIHRRCILQREILKNRLLLALVVPDAVSQLIQGKEGYVGQVLGEVLYILRCVPKHVTIRRTDRCYQQLPIEINNQSKFMSPVTRILQDYGEEIDCNSMTPPLYYIEGEWVGLVPYPTLRNPPKELEAGIHSNIKFQPIQPIGAGGLYTQEEISKVKKLLTFGIERKAVENIITRRVAGKDTEGQGYSTLGMFNPEEIKQLAHSTIKQMWGWFSDLGIFMSGLIGFYVIFRLIKYTIGVVINGLHLYQTVGGGFALLACLWNTLTMWVIHNHHREARETPISGNSAAKSDELETVRVGEEVIVGATGQNSACYPDLSTAPHWTEVNSPSKNK